MADTDTIDTASASDQPTPSGPSTMDARSASDQPTAGIDPRSAVEADPNALDTRSATEINPQSVIDQMTQAASAAAPQMADPNTIEGAAAAVHHSRLAQTLHNVINSIGDVLGGPQTVHVTKNQDGTVSVTHDPSTMGEKWSRVAQAALGGLAKGFAAGPGPGGPQRAAAAGIQSGMALPQQREDQANQIANQQNQAFYQKQNADASKAIHQQEIAKNTMQLSAMGSKFTQDQVDRANENGEWLLSNPSNKLVGTMGSMREVLDFEKNNPDMMHNMTHGGYHVEATNEDGKPVFKLYTYDQAWGDQMNDQPVTYKRLKQDGSGDLEDYTVPKGRMPNKDIAQAQEAATKDITAYHAAQVKNLPKTPAELALAAQDKSNPTRAAAAAAALQQLQNSPEITATIAEKKAATAKDYAQANEAKFKIGQGPQGAALVDAVGTGHVTAERLAYLMARNPDLIASVTQKYPDFDSSKAGQYANTYKEFTSSKPGTAGAALNNGATALKHLKELSDLNTDASHIPGTNAYTAYMNKAETVASELAKFYGNSTIPAIEGIKKGFYTTLPGNRESAITTQIGSMGDKLDSYEQTWKNAAPSSAYEAPMPGIDKKAMAARAALDPEYRARLQQEQQGTTPAPAAPAAGGAPAPAQGGAPAPDPQLIQRAAAAGVPNDGHAYIVNGKIVGYYEKDGKTYHNLPTAGAR